MAEDVRVFDLSYNNARVEIATGRYFEVALPEQTGTGFKWKIVSGQIPVKDFRDPAGPSRGATTSRHFRFQAEWRGESVISLRLCRSWEPQAPARQFTITVSVR